MTYCIAIFYLLTPYHQAPLGTQVPEHGNMNDSQSHKVRSSSQNERHFRNDTKKPNFSRLDPLSAAASIIGVYGYAAEISLKLTNIFRDMNGSCQVLLLSRRLEQYTGLLISASGVVTTSMFSGELR